MQSEEREGLFMHSIRTKISAVTIGAIIITMIIAAVFGVAAIRNIGQDSSEQMLRLLCDAGQKNLNAGLQDVEQNVQTISAYVESDLDGLEDQKLQAHLDRVSDFFKKVLYNTNGVMTYYYRIDPAVSSKVKGFWFVNTDGEGFQEHEVTDITRYDTTDTSQLVWFTVPKATGRPVWLPPYVTDNLDARVISYNTPVYLDGKFVGVIGIELDYSFMAEQVDNITLYENGYAFVDDGKGAVVYHPHMDVVTMETLPETPEGLASEDEIIRYQYKNVEKMAVSRPLCNGDRLIVSVPVKEINAGWQRWVKMIVIAFALLLAAFIVFISRFTKRITKPLQDLTKVAEQIEEGNYDHSLDYDEDDEIGILTRTFSRVTANLKTYITDLNHLTEQLTLQKESESALLDNMPAVNFSKDAVTGAYLYCNQGFAEYANKENPSDVIGLTDADIFDPDTVRHFTEDDKKALAMDTPYVFFEDVADAEGNPRQFRTTKMKFYDSSGRMCLLGMCMDVTELERIRRESDETKAAYQEALTASTVYGNIVDALVQDFFDVYYVNVDTNAYIEYGSWTEEGKRATERQGEDFFSQSRTNARHYIVEEDQERFIAALEKEKLLKEITRHGAYIIYYRLRINGVPTYVRLKATHIPGDDRHIIIGVSNVDTQMRDRKAAERAAEETKSYQRLSALSGNLMALFYVDPETNAYTQFSASAEYSEFGFARQGSDFFRAAYQDGLKTIHPDDLPLFQSQVTKENILAAIERDGMFVLAYRIMRGDVPIYVRLKAAKVVEDGKALLIIGLMNEDAQIRQEQEYARDLSIAKRMATVDSLTGVKNKHAYAQWEEKIDTEIKAGQQQPFAAVVCDVNNLKAVNDLYGHKEGDACILKACRKICAVFSHSPVFRVGGDEFVILLTGEDYGRRKSLMEQITALPADRSKIRIGETIAAGIADYNRKQHYSLASVLEEADKAMYENKKQLKEVCRVEEYSPETVPESKEISLINTRKTVLIVDDVALNREILGDLLEDDFDILFAADGIETLEILRSHKDEIDLVLLDLQMPNKNGREVMAEMQVDEDLMSIPVLILTVDQNAELDCLKIGAMDFIPKPFPSIEIVKARIAKCIELSEDRDLIRHTERDKLTELLNKDYFLRYVNRLDHIYKGTPMDAVALDVNRFHMLNKQYGRQFGDLVLHSIGVSLRKLARQTGGIGCRQGGDTFLLYCPHQEDYEKLLSGFLDDIHDNREIGNKVSMRFGLYLNAQRVTTVEERFARAKTAADSVKDDPQSVCGYYKEA